MSRAPKQLQDQAAFVEQFDANNAALEAAADAENAAAAAAEAEGAVVAPTAAPAQPAELPPIHEPWEQRYKSLKGMFDTTVPVLEGQVQTLSRQVEELSKRSAPAAAPVVATPAPTTTDQDVADYGQDLVNMIKRAAGEVASQMLAGKQVEIDGLKTELASLKKETGTVAERQFTNDQVRFVNSLREQVPNWEQLNVDQQFLAWLAEADPMSGQPRQTFLQSAVDARDADRTARMFKAWPGYEASTAPAPAAQPAPVVPRPSPSPVPSRVTPTTPEPNVAETTWTRAGIEKFYADVGRGQYRGQEAEQARIEAEIDSAVQGNRVRA